MDNFTIGLRYGGGSVGFANGNSGVNPAVFPACQHVLQAWMPSTGPCGMPGYLQSPPFFYPMAPDMGCFPMPGPGWGCPMPFNNPFQGMCPSPYQPPYSPAYGGYQPSVPNYGAGYRYPEYGQMQQRARENGTLDGTPVTPHSSFHEDQFHTDALSRLNQRAAGRVMDEARAASPREFQALQRNESQLQNYLRQQFEQGATFSPSQINRFRAEGIETLFQDGQVGQGIGQANREHLELLEAWERSEANQQMKYGVGPLPGLPPRVFAESPFNPQRQAPPQQQQQVAPRPAPVQQHHVPQRPHAQQQQQQQRPGNGAVASQATQGGTAARPTSKPVTAGQAQDIQRLHPPPAKPAAGTPPQPPGKPTSAGTALGGKPGAPGAAQPGKPQPKPYDPNKDSNELYKAMHGGLLGMGTDEGAIFKALEGKSPEQVAKIRANYKDHYGKDLDKDLKGELGGKDWQRAEALLKGKQEAADATGLRQAIEGLGTDEKAVFKTLEGKTAEQRQAIAREYKSQTGRELRADIKGDLSGAERDRANALLDGNQARADAATLQHAVKGLGTDEAAIMETLKGKNAEQRAAIQKSYKEQYGVDLSKSLKGDLSGSELDQANALLQGNNAKAAAAQIRTAASGWGTDEKSINESLEGKSAEERQAIADAYKQTYGKELKSELKSELSGNDLQRSEALLERGKVSDAEELKFATEGWGTDEEAVKKALEGKSKEEIAQLRQDYQRLTNRQLDADLNGEMTGRDQFDTQQALKGRAETVQEAVDRANEVHAYERKGGANAVSRGFVDLFSDKGELLDTNTARVNESKAKFDQLVAEGRLDEARVEKQRLQELTGFTTADVETYREAKDSAADTAGTVAATAAGVAVVVATAGTATPLVATVALAAGAGAGARVVTTGLIKGQGYGVEDGLMDAGQGAIDGGTAIIGMGAGSSAKVAVKAGQEGAELAAREALVSTGKVIAGKAEQRLVVQGAGDILENQGGQFIRKRVIQGAKDGALGGALGAGGSEIVHDGTWDNGLADGLTRVATSAAIGAGAGGVAGGVMSPFGARREWTGEVDLYRNRANFDILDDAQKIKFAGLAENYSKGAAFVDGGPSRDVDGRLIRMLRDGTVDKVDHTGATVVDNLSKLDNQAMAPGLSNRVIMDEVLETVHRPGIIFQDNRGSCSVTTVEYLHVRKDPSDYIRVIGDLTSEGSETTLKNGERVLRNPSSLAADNSARNNIDRIYQSTMMDYGGGGHYDNAVDGHIQIDGRIGSQGLADKGYNRVEDGVLGGHWENRWFRKTDTQAVADFEKHASGVFPSGEHVPVGMRWSPDPNDLHAGHMVSVYKVDDDYVYVRNPWGKGEKGGTNGPPRQVLDAEGNVRIKKQDFYDRLQSYDVQVTTQNKAPVDLDATRQQILDRFRKQQVEYADSGWEKDMHEFQQQWDAPTREKHRSILHDRASNIIKDLEAGGDVHDVAAKYNLTEHYGLGDRFNRSEQFINRTEGLSNEFGVDKLPPIPSSTWPPLPEGWQPPPLPDGWKPQPFTPGPFNPPPLPPMPPPVTT